MTFGVGYRQVVALSVLWALTGCTSLAAHRRMASSAETMCKHCNCLMPAGVDPEAICPVCECGYKAHQCVRGR